MVRVSYYGYDNISSSLIHVNIMRLKGYAVKGLHFDCRSKKQWVRFLHISILTNSMVELYIPNIKIQVQVLSKNTFYRRA